ncbi:guanine nucleotide exchange factor for Rab-3A-like [Stegodyphus dumicola]|uniref:guanine nucleotide exchange factor for Rab-3A-like n=1 Tax=Stegodyphus dumicola TaxID=202533 RepID=UPI0015B1A208|nr:guanine nucleotide exchange factor for Rab-3A-like [Stegodyphus dumicola]XP_035224587.1 guanine nucleotide exchange factor for Rab-3A-like [Stegodyphus dumicola]
MHYEIASSQPKEVILNDANKISHTKSSDKNGLDTTSSCTSNEEGIGVLEVPELSEKDSVPCGDSLSIWKATSRRCSSDGALKAMQGNLVPKPERGNSFSDSDEKTAALKAKINEKYQQLEQEMAAKACANGLTLSTNSPSSQAVLELGDKTAALLSPDPRMVPPEDTCVFTSGGPAGVLCELKTTEDPLPGRNSLMAEVKELAYSRLQQELQKAQLELKLKDEEVVRLSQIRDEVGAELEELTASLFEEANNMVREANVKQAYAEKMLKEANLKIEVLQAEVQALKTLVITSTPSMPNPHLHPQIDKRHNGVRSLFTPGHKRSPSNYELCSYKETPPGSPTKESDLSAFSPDNYEVDPVFHQEFLEWHQSPTLDKNTPFLSNIYKEDILPCLHFTNSKLSQAVLSAIEENAITIELVNGKNPFPKRCALLEAPRLCKYRMKLGDNPEWHYISHLCRNRIAAVCDFFCYIRYIQQGLVKSGIHEIYWEVIRRRRDVSLARLGILTL